MNTLTPKQAAAIATGVYRIMHRSIADLRARGGDLDCEEQFFADDAARFTGLSGQLAWKEITGFGYIAEGKESRKGQVLLVTRGTQTKPDWLSNLNIGLQPGPGGYPVHAGFNQIWKSFAPEIKSFLRNRNPGLIHCIGHSLGGALANLSADYLSAAGAGQVNLYTFGAPRIGTALFADNLAARIGSDHLFRVYHGSDPVPMIPVFPFQHAPVDRYALAVRTNERSLISINAHLMPSYTAAVARFEDWPSVAAAAREPELTPDMLESWLMAAAAVSGPVLVGNAYVLKMIGKVLGWLLARAVDLIGLTLTCLVTLLDYLAWMLSKAAQFSKELAWYVEKLIKVIFEFLGRPVQSGVSLTLAFIRFVLELLLDSVGGVARRAIDLVGQ